MENSFLPIFDKIWPKTMYYSTGTLAQFWSNFKNSQKKSNFDWNQFKLDTQHKDMYMYHKNYKNGKFSPSHFLQNLAKDHVHVL